MDDRRNIRAADPDRQHAADRLRRAMEEGRLDLLEYDTRLGRAYSALTYGDLDQLFIDLPTPTGTSGPRTRNLPAAWAPVPVSGAELLALVPTPLKVLWTIWLAVLSTNLTVWLVLSLQSAEPVYFWPIWLLVSSAPLPGVTAGVIARRRKGGGRRQAMAVPMSGTWVLD